MLYPDLQTLYETRLQYSCLETSGLKESSLAIEKKIRCHNSYQTYFCWENNPQAARNGLIGSCSPSADRSLEVKKKNHHNENINFHLIWVGSSRDAAKGKEQS